MSSLLFVVIPNSLPLVFLVHDSDDPRDKVMAIIILLNMD